MKIIILVIAAVMALTAVNALAEKSKPTGAKQKYDCTAVTTGFNDGTTFTSDYIDISLDALRDNIITEEKHTGSAEYVCKKMSVPYHAGCTEKVETIVHGTMNYKNAEYEISESVCANPINYKMDICDDNSPYSSISTCKNAISPEWEKEAVNRVLETKKKFMQKYNKPFPKKKLCDSDGTIKKEVKSSNYNKLTEYQYTKDHQYLSDICINEVKDDNPYGFVNKSYVDNFLDVVTPKPEPTFGQKVKNFVVCSIFNM